MNRINSLCMIVVLVSVSLWSATYRVGKTGAQFTTVQAAVNQAGPGDIIEIIDYGVYEEQVSIDSTKSRLTLRSSNPASPNKPTIKHKDIVNVHPKNGTEAQNPNMINFDQNGALRVLGAKNVTIEGICVDGGGHYTFCWDNVWESRYPLFHGNAAIVVWVSGYTTIRHCNIKNAHFGIAFKDRNEGGIFGNANPADIQPWNVVPLSNYGQVGGHLVEQNRISDNVVGLYNESAWDMGSTVRYNLIFENHYIGNEGSQTSGWDGGSHPGGGFEFKDNALTPWAIYNNTLWHNFQNFSGQWQAGAQHLIFNNIYGIVSTLWVLDNSYGQKVGVHAMDKSFPNRMKHCVYDLMQQKPNKSQQTVQAGQTDPATNQYVEVKKTVDVIQYMVIQNQMDVTRSDLIVQLDIPLTNDTVTVFKTINNGAVANGANIKPFPVSAKVGYFPVPFKSTDPTSSDFLVPDWADTAVQRLILDNGWADAGIIDADGSPADLGAIPKGGIPTDKGAMISLAPVTITGTEALINFNFQTNGTFTNPKVKYIKCICPLLFNADTWGNNVDPIVSAAIQNVTIISGDPLSIGQNTLKVSAPSGVTDYAFYEIFVEGTGSQGKKVVSSTGFHPYRKLDYYFEVWVTNLDTTDTLTEVVAGDKVLLHVEAYNKDGSKFINDIDSGEVNLVSGANLYEGDLATIFSNKIIKIPKGYLINEVIFTKVPDPNGLEYVQANGLWREGSNAVAFHGISDAIRILPGLAAQIVFQDPPSNKFGAAPPIIDPGINFDGYLEVYDRFDNAIDKMEPYTLSVENNNSNGTVVSTNPHSTDTTGRGDFTITVQGNEGDIVSFISTLVTTVNGTVYDTADVKIGKPKNQLWVFYDDIGSYDSTKKLEGEIGQRLKTTIGVTKDGIAIETGITNVKITVKPMDTDPLLFYSSATAATEQSEFTLTSGQVDVWVTSFTENNATGPGYGMTTYPSDVSSGIATIDRSTRYKLYFNKNLPESQRAAFFDKNGDGFVDSATITYKDTLKAVPDTIDLCWPDATNKKRIYDKSKMALSANKKTVYVTINPPFTTVQTSGNGVGQTWHEVRPGVSEAITAFSVLDSVGPRLLDEAFLYERFTAGNDTLLLTVSENIRAAHVMQDSGASFVLVKQGGNELNLTILGNIGSTDDSTLTIAIADLGNNAPVGGDSIKIYAPGPVKDTKNNRAHVNNPPVPIKIRAKPVPVDSASYWDMEANGVVEKLLVYLKKKVSVGAIEKVDVTWTGSGLTATANVTDITYAGVDSSVIQIMLTDIFTVADLSNEGTGGAMTVAITYNGMTGAETGSVSDRAAPVVKKASYLPGKTINADENLFDPDNLNVTFTENVVSNAFNEPFLFLNTATDSTYRILLESSNYSADAVTALVDTIIGRKYPGMGDSVWINTVAGIEDGSANIQTNTKNKKVPLDVTKRPINLIIKAVTPVAPKEYIFSTDIYNKHLNGTKPSFSSGVYFRINPQKEPDPGEVIFKKISIMIVDAVGNLVASGETIDNDDGLIAIMQGTRNGMLHIFWSGKNQNKRYVGSGVYLCILEIDMEGEQVVKKISIGILDSAQ